MCADKTRAKEQRLQKSPSADLLHSQEVRKPWYDSKPEAPEYLTVQHEAFKPRLSRELQSGDKLTVYVQPPGKEVPGGLEHAPIDATYELLQPGEPGGAPVGRLDLVKIRNYMVGTKRYKAEVLDNDIVEIWPTDKPDHFVMGLIKEKCTVCQKETGDEANGRAYICDKCNRGVHAVCAGISGVLHEEDEFLCPTCLGPKAEAGGKEPAAAAGGDAEEESDSTDDEEEEEEAEEDEDYEAKGKGKGKGKGKAAAKDRKKAKRVEIAADGAAEPTSKRQKK